MVTIMHMVDALLSPAVGGMMCVVSASANVYAAKKVKRDELCEKKIPIIGVMGAFIFAAQMINFAIPGTGSSGHIGGGILLAAVIGGFPALVSISVVLIIQCLFFADGGVLALGCNIFNLGVIPCLIVYPLLLKPFVTPSNRRITTRRITFASIISVVLSLQLGSLCVVIETQLSNISELPFATFLMFMQPIHLAIGIAEGLITAGILCFVHKMRPDIMRSAAECTAIQDDAPTKRLLITLTILTLIVGCVLSLFASSRPDGLEWAIAKTGETVEIEPARVSEGASNAGAAIAGIVGGSITFAFACIAAYGISIFKKKRKGELRA